MDYARVYYVHAKNKDKVIKQICFTCEQERVYNDNIERLFTEGLTGNCKSTGSGRHYKEKA